MLSEAKVKVGIFVGSQIKNVIECQEFPKFIRTSRTELWINIVKAINGFLGNHKAENYVELTKIMDKKCRKMRFAG